MTVRVGIEELMAHDFAPIRGKRVGLMTNPSAVDARLVSTYTLLYRSDDVRLTALFAPEHGAFAQARESEMIASAPDPRTGLPVYSLYGDTYRPVADMLADIDLMICDIQDIGVRYYTFLWTITHIIEACGEHGVPVMILDRPNPLGDTIAGRGVDPVYASLVGRYDIPIQHGMTLGELAQMHNDLWNPTPAELTIIPCDGYSRSMTWQQTGRVFVPPSPNMPHPLTAQHYPGACLIEGTTLSEGRGTALPFEITGAPGIEGHHLAQQLNQRQLPGVRFRAHQFKPALSKYANHECSGIQVHIMDESYQPIATWLHVIQILREIAPQSVGWRPTFSGDNRFPFDKLIGSDIPRKQIDAGVSVHEIIEDWQPYLATFEQRRAPYLLYSRGEHN